MTEERVGYMTSNEPSPTKEIRDRRKSYFFQTDNDLVLRFAKHIKPIGLSVYTVLAAHAGSKDRAWPSRKRMADILGVSKPTVDKGLQLLKDYGIIEIENNLDERGVHTSNTYTLIDISEWFWHKLEEGGSQKFLPPLVKNFDHPSQKFLPEEYTLNNTQVEQDVQPPQPKGEEAQDIDPYTYYRVHIEGKKKISQVVYMQIDHMVVKYGKAIVLEAMKQALLNNKHPGKPTFNFIDAIALRLQGDELTSQARLAAIRRSEDPPLERQAALPESFYLEVDGLSAYRERILQDGAEQ